MVGICYQRGVTLLELLISITLLAVILGLAAGLTQHWLWQYRAQRDVRIITTFVNNARFNAQIGHFNTRICPVGADQNCGSRWQDGLLLQANNLSISQSPQLAAASKISFNRSQLDFDRDGFTRGTNGSFLYCAPASAHIDNIKIIINRAGRLRTETSKESC